MPAILKWRFPLAKAPWLNCLTMVWLFFFFFALGLGSVLGPSLVPRGHELSEALGVANIVAYLGFFVGSLDFVGRGHLALGALATGLLARGFYEFHTSLLKRLWLEQFPLNGYVIAFAAGFYLLTFILPALLMIDRWRFEKERPPDEKTQDWIV